jgi:hypothetical protein
MKDEACPRSCLVILIVSLLLYYPFEHFTPAWLHDLTGLLLLGSILVYLGWCGYIYTCEGRRGIRNGSSPMGRHYPPGNKV